jgi:hypothetical protein
MKKSIFTPLLIAGALVLGTNANAQYCGNSGPSVCVASGMLPGPGFEPLDSIPSVERTIPYTHAVQFNMYSQFNFQGQQTVDSMEFISISNLPSGLCWSTDHANNRYRAGESGCLKITGTTWDPAGQYKLSLNVTAWINGGQQGVTPGTYLVDQAGVRLWIRVKNAGSNDVAVDTSQSANNLTATGINEVSSSATDLSIVPNPVSSSANLSFTAEKSATYTLRINDVTGKVVSVKQIQAVQGINNVTIERNNLQAGVYFVSLTDGRSIATRRFSVVE